MRRTSSKLEGRRPSTSTAPDAWIAAVTAARSPAPRRGALISTTNGLPRPSIRASMSSRPIPWRACPCPPRASISGAATISSTLVAYIFPVPPQRGHPRPPHTRHGHRVWGGSRLRLRGPLSQGTGGDRPLGGVELGVHDGGDVGVLRVSGLPRQALHALPDLSVELPLDGLLVRGPDALPDPLLGGGDGRGDACPDLEGAELD